MLDYMMMPTFAHLGVWGLAVNCAVTIEAVPNQQMNGIVDHQIVVRSCIDIMDGDVLVGPIPDDGFSWPFYVHLRDIGDNW